MKTIIMPIKLGELSFAEQGMLEYMINDGYNGYNLDDFDKSLPDNVFFIKQVLDRLISLGYVVLKENRYYINQDRVSDAAYYQMVVV